MDKFLREVDLLCKHVHRNTRFINAGGCAVFAAFMGQCLARYGKVEIAVGSDDGPTVEELRPCIDVNRLGDWNDNGFSFCHVVVEFTHKGKVYHVDSTGVHPQKKKAGTWPIVDGRITVKEITNLAASDGWNSISNRQQIPNVKKMINDGFINMFNQGLIPTLR